MRVLAIGECMAELAPSDRAGDYTLGFAGDTFNTAWYLARIAPETEVSYLTAVGDDALSHDMRAFMRESGINDAHVRTIVGETIGLYMIHLSGGERSFSYWRSASAARHLARDAEALDRAMADVDLIYYSGITLAILDAASRDTLFAALRRARDTGKTIAFDTNLRPRLWSNTDEMTSTVRAAAAQSDIVLPSFDDEAAWFGDAGAEATRDRYAALGPAHIAVKNNAEPVVFLSDGQQGAVDVAQAQTIVDTTAAGDSFNAGVLAGVLRGNDLVAGIEAGCRLARHVVQHKGALVRGPNDQDARTG